MHVVCYYLFKAWKWNEGSTGKTGNAGVLAHYVPFLLCFVSMAAYGNYLWVTDEALASESFDRIWGYHDGGFVILVSMLAVQLYDIPVSLAVPELRVASFLLHHMAVLYLTLMGLKYQCFYYYAVYFLGVIETSSPFLTAVDAFRD